MKVIIDIDEEDFRIMQHNVAVDNPLCPLSEKETVTKIANGMPIFDNAISRDVFNKIEEEKLFDCNNIGFEAKFINAIPIPDNATNGDMVEKIFGKDVFLTLITMMYVPCCKKLDKWWKAPYKKGAEE